MLAIGIWTRVQEKDFDSIFGSGGIGSASNILIAAGAVIIVVSLIGCRAIWNQNRCLMTVVCLVLSLVHSSHWPGTGAEPVGCQERSQ